MTDMWPADKAAGRFLFSCRLVKEQAAPRQSSPAPKLFDENGRRMRSGSRIGIEMSDRL